MKSILVILFTLFFSLDLLAKTRPFGHNVSHTDNILGESRCTIGYQMTGCRIDQAFIGSSPFLNIHYNMYNLFLRLNFNRTKDSVNTFQVSLYDTFGNSQEVVNQETLDYRQNYLMTALFASYIYTHKYNATYTYHLNLIYNHYNNDQFPFSIRRPTVKRSKHQINVTNLFEAKLTESFLLLGEFGVLHLNDVYPRFHTGASLGFSSGSLYAQLGFSITSTFQGMFASNRNPDRSDYQLYLFSTEDGYDSEMDREAIRNDFSLHPEITVQYQF